MAPPSCVVIRASLLAFLACGLIVNAILIGYVLRQKVLRQSPTFVILTSLAIADICLIVIAMADASNELGQQRMLSDIWCKVTNYTISVFAGTVQAHLVAFSVFRYFILTRPIWSLRVISPRRAVVVCLFCWMVNLVISLGSAFFTVAEEDTTLGNYTSVTCHFKQSYAYVIIPFYCVSNVGYFAAIVIFHVAKIVKLRKIPDLLSDENRHNRRHVSSAAVCAIIITFGIAWIPSVVFGAVVYLSENSKQFPGYVSTVVWPVLQWLFFSNSVINPVVYFLFSRKNTIGYCFRSRPQES